MRAQAAIYIYMIAVQCDSNSAVPRKNLLFLAAARTLPRSLLLHFGRRQPRISSVFNWKRRSIVAQPAAASLLADRSHSGSWPACWSIVAISQDAGCQSRQRPQARPRLRQALRAACLRPTSSIPLRAAVNSLAEAVVVAAHERLQGP